MKIHTLLVIALASITIAAPVQLKEYDRTDGWQFKNTKATFDDITSEGVRTDGQWFHDWKIPIFGVGFGGVAYWLGGKLGFIPDHSTKVPPPPSEETLKHLRARPPEPPAGQSPPASIPPTSSSSPPTSSSPPPPLSDPAASQLSQYTQAPQYSQYSQYPQNSQYY